MTTASAPGKIILVANMPLYMDAGHRRADFEGKATATVEEAPRAQAVSSFKGF